MQAAEVPESTTKRIIGHKRASLTYGHYSKGERLKLCNEHVSLTMLAQTFERKRVTREGRRIPAPEEAR
jgi:hypothetical protein